MGLHYQLSYSMASKSYGWDVRNIAKINPKMAKKQPFLTFFICKNCPFDSNEIFYSHFLHHSMVLCVQFHQICMTGIRASQKEKDLSRLLYRICGSGKLITSFLICKNEKNFSFSMAGGIETNFLNSVCNQKELLSAVRRTVSFS